MFEFVDPGKLVDGELELILKNTYPGDNPGNRAPFYRFRMGLVGKRDEVGQIDLRAGNTQHVVMYAGHIGYRVHAKYRGHRYAARACQMLFPLARYHELNPLWITCNPDNLPSRRTCEILRAEFVEIVDLPKNTDMYMSGDRQKCRYRLSLDGIDGSGIGHL